MTVNVGVIGVGMIGQDHIRRLTKVLAGSAVVAVTDVDAARTKSVADGLPGAKAFATGQELITDKAVDAVVVASWGGTHEEYVLACIAAGKPVFCEKPLATSQDACLRILEAEMKFGRRLVQVGFMRRYDAAYRALKATLASGAIGAPLMVHCAHRNASVPGHYTSDMAINDTTVHEVDLVRWLLDEEIVSTQVLTPRRNSRAGDLRDPLFVLFEMASGAIVDVEVSVNIAYGYDIRGEIVGETGTVDARREQHGRGQARGRLQRPGARGLARAVHHRLRCRVPRMAGRGRGRHRHRAQLLGRLRRHRRLRRRAGGAAQRQPAERGAAAEARLLRLRRVDRGGAATAGSSGLPSAATRCRAR